MRTVTPLFFINVVGGYSRIYDQLDNCEELELPKLRQEIPQIQLTATLQKIQLRWLEAVTGRTWGGQEFHEFWWQVASWMTHTIEVESCPDDQLHELWMGSLWKRGATEILGLNKVGE